MKDENVHPALRPKETTVIQLRTVPNDLHRQMRTAAIEDGVSLELFVLSTLVEAMQQRGKAKRAKA